MDLQQKIDLYKFLAVYREALTPEEQELFNALTKLLANAI